MAIRVTIRNTTTAVTLAAQDIPESAVAAIQRAFPGAPAEAATEALTFMLNELRLAVREARQNIKGQEQQVLTQTAMKADAADFDTNEWPIT